MQKELPIIPNRSIPLVFSGVLTLASIIFALTFGFRPGLDFKGGTAWQVNFQDAAVSLEDVGAFLRAQDMENVQVTRELTTKSLIMRFGSIDEPRHQELGLLLRERFGDLNELSFDSIGPAIGKELRDKAIWAGILVLLGISLYVAYAFRTVSYPVRSWQYGIVTLLTLFHDAIITIGFVVLLGRFLGVEVDSNTVVALLVVIGFSVHDTIVVFDRIRENIRLQSAKAKFDAVVNKSINETFARSINTSLTLVLVLVALLLFGPPSLTYFLMTIAVGVIFGTYSSIFVASPLLVAWYARKNR